MIWEETYLDNTASFRCRLMFALNLFLTSPFALIFTRSSSLETLAFLCLGMFGGNFDARGFFDSAFFAR